MLRATAWGPADAELTIFCDACLTGIAFWCPQLNKGFIADVPTPTQQGEDIIFWYEALAVLSALQWAISLPSRYSRIAIFTDNLNTVQIFNSLRVSEGFEDLLLFACGLLIASDVDLRVWHIAGTDNLVADALSRHLIHVALQHVPQLHLHTFIPSRITLGDAVL
ncbi:hypothetical protein BKA93DRAFT_723692 [Sparassis latifolia]